MAVTYSEMMALGTQAPPFDLPTTNPEIDDVPGANRRLDDYAAADVLVVIFTCNHCPYAVHVEDALIQMARDYAGNGVRFVAICSNDADKYPRDGFDAMAERARAKDFPFPYLHDETQAVARAYDAACTPDIYVFGKDRTLKYRGRFDDTRPGRGTPTGKDLRQAIDELLDTGAVTVEQYPSMGCNIKWK